MYFAFHYYRKRKPGRRQKNSNKRALNRRRRSKKAKNERDAIMRIARRIRLRRGRSTRPRQFRMAFPIRRRTPYPRLDLLQSPLFQRSLPLRPLPVTTSHSLSIFYFFTPDLILLLNRFSRYEQFLQEEKLLEVQFPSHFFS